MRFYFEPMPLTGMTDVMSVQAIGMWGDNTFVIEAKTEDEAREKLLDLLEKRVWQGEVRPATEDEAKEFEERQYEAYELHESVARTARAIRQKGWGMSKQPKRRKSEIVQSSKQPSKVSVLAELLRLTEQAGTMEISRDYFRANSRFRDKWNMYWPSFKAFLAAGIGGE